MTGIRVKICGINSEASFDAAIEARADWIGFVFFPRSPRFVAPERAAQLSLRYQGGPPRVGLFVMPTEAEIANTLKVLPLDVLQIYGPLKRAASLSQRLGRPLWRVIGVAGHDDLPSQAEGADALLIEAKAPLDSPRPGGNAQRFDWSVLAGWRAPVPWLLAGGLTPQNVAEAIQMTGASAVDVSSGVERSPGVKEPALIRAFIAAARGAGG